jgi:CheY-like chemotaxis protein
MEGRLIAVVDDDADLREVVGEILDDAGYRALPLPGAREALAVLRSLEAPPSLILLDLMMPGMSGWEFREEQLRDPALCEIPVVVMTASKGLDQHPISVNEILHKPVHLEVLLAAVGRNAA